MEGCAYIGYAWARIMAHLIAKHGIKMGNLILKGPYLHNMAKQEMVASNKARTRSKPVHAATQHATKLKVGQTQGDLQKLKKLGKAGKAFGCATDDTPVQWVLMKCWVLCKPDGNPVLLVVYNGLVGPSHGALPDTQAKKNKGKQ